MILEEKVIDTLPHLVVNSYNKPNYFSFSLNHKNLQLSFVILVPIIHIFHLYWSVIDDLFAFHYITRNGTKDIIWLFKKLRLAIVSIDPWPHFCQILLIDHTTHLAGRTDLPLQIGTDKRGVISYCLGSGGWEISKKKIFHLAPCEILPCQISVY